MNVTETLPGPCPAAVPAGEGLAKFLQLRGYDVVETLGVRWHRVSAGLYMSLPYHRCLDLGPARVAEALRSSRILGLRYPSVTRRGLPSGHYVCRPDSYDLTCIDPKVRRAMKRGLAECEVRRVTHDELLKDGLALSRTTMQRQGRFDPEFGDPAKWARFVNSAAECPCIHVYGSFVEGSLIAMAVTCVEDDWLSVLYRMSNYTHPELHASHVLDYTIVHDLARKHAVQMCSFGLVPLVDNPGLHCYKTRMGLRLEPQFSVIQLHPAVEPILTNRISVAAVSATSRLSGRVDGLERTNSVLKGAALSRISGPLPNLSSLGPGPDCVCQFSTYTDYSRLSRPYPVFLLQRLIWLLRTEGPAAAVRRARFFLARRFRKPAKVGRPTTPEAASGDSVPLQEGEWVEVKSAAEIKKTLDSNDRCKGLSFLPEMEQYCGKRFHVLKRVERIFMEESGQQRRLKNTVLLEGVYCSGRGVGCDRCCFLFWRDTWLKRVENGGSGSRTA